MSVIVRGMEMPKNCKECPFSDHEAWCLLPGDWRERYYCPDDERSADCPLISIPKPHGRLGDLDALWDRMYKYSDNEGAKMPFGDNDFMIHRDSACELIEDAPTVIEAEDT
mgnify:CR=1 FL=1